MSAPAPAYAAIPSTRPRPAVNAKTARTSAVPMTATTFSMRSSRDRAARTWAATAVPQDGQRPPGLRTRGVPQVGQSTWRRTGTRGTVADAGRQAKAANVADGARLSGVRLLTARRSPPAARRGRPVRAVGRLPAHAPRPGHAA